MKSAKNVHKMLQSCVRKIRQVRDKLRRREEEGETDSAPSRGFGIFHLDKMKFSTVTVFSQI
jgi:hypothetical protein